MKTPIEKQIKEQPQRQRSKRLTTGASQMTNFATSNITPILSGFYYAVSADNTSEFTMMQVIEVSTNTDLHTAIKVRQFAPVYKVLPDYLIPEQLGLPVAQFWLPLDEFDSWQPMLMQRGVVTAEILAN